MDAAQVGVGQHHVRDLGAVARHHRDHSLGQAGLGEQVRPEGGRVGLGERGLPHHGVAHQRRGGRQVAGDGGEVERRDRVDEAVQRPVVHPVPHRRRGERLVGVQLAGEGDVEPQEVDQLAGRVDLGLLHGLALAQHGGGVQPVAPRPGEQFGGLQEDRRPLVEVERGPARLGGLRGRDRGLGVRRGRLVDARQQQTVIGRRPHLIGLPAAGAHLDRRGRQGRQRPLQRLPLQTARRVPLDRFVRRQRHPGDGLDRAHLTCSSLAGVRRTS